MPINVIDVFSSMDYLVVSAFPTFVELEEPVIAAVVGFEEELKGNRLESDKWK